MPSGSAFWDKIAAKYAARPLPNPDSTAKKLDVIRDLMKPDHRVVDVGCGTGTIAVGLAPNAEHVLGIDVSDAMLDFGRRKVATAGIANVSFERADVLKALQDLPIASMHGVLAFNILHLTSDWRPAVSRVYEVLKPGGYFVSSTACLADSRIPLKPVIHLMKFFGKAPEVIEFFRGDELLQLMRDVGFEDLSTPEVGTDRTNQFVVARKPG